MAAARSRHAAAMLQEPLRQQPVALAGVPALLTSHLAPERAAERGTVLVLHGLTASKEIQGNESRALAELGYLAVAIDAVGHGARRYPDFDARFPVDDPARGERSFYDVVEQTQAELPLVIGELLQRGWALPGKLGGFGISMGGFILLGAVTDRCPLDAVVTVVSSPRRTLGDSPHQHLDRFFPTPLLMITCGKDAVVPTGPVRETAAQLAPYYEGGPRRLRYLELAEEDHMFTPPGWKVAWDATCDWFAHFLRS